MSNVYLHVFNKRVGAVVVGLKKRNTPSSLSECIYKPSTDLLHCSSKLRQWLIDLCKLEVKLEVSSHNVLSLCHLGSKVGLSNYSLTYCDIQMAFQSYSPDPQRPLRNLNQQSALTNQYYLICPHLQQFTKLKRTP